MWGQKALSEFMGWNTQRSDSVLCGPLMPSKQRMPQLHGGASRELSRFRVDFLYEQRGLILQTAGYLKILTFQVWTWPNRFGVTPEAEPTRPAKPGSVPGAVLSSLRKEQDQWEFYLEQSFSVKKNLFLYTSTNKLRKLLSGCRWCNTGKHWEGEADPEAAVAGTKCKSQGKSY